MKAIEGLDVVKVGCRRIPKELRKHVDQPDAIFDEVFGQNRVVDLGLSAGFSVQGQLQIVIGNCASFPFELSPKLWPLEDDLFSSDQMLPVGNPSLQVIFVVGDNVIEVGGVCISHVGCNAGFGTIHRSKYFEVDPGETVVCILGRSGNLLGRHEWLLPGSCRR